MVIAQNIKEVDINQQQNHHYKTVIEPMTRYINEKQIFGSRKL